MDSVPFQACFIAAGWWHEHIASHSFSIGAVSSAAALGLGQESLQSIIIGTPMLLDCIVIPCLGCSLL